MERDDEPKRIGRIAGGAVILLLPFLAFLTIAFDGGDTFLYEDGLLYSFPLRVFLHDAFAHGYSPQWMPHSACGFSPLAEGQSGICFPAAQILYRLFSAESGWLVEMMASHLVAFFCCRLLLRHLGMSRLASLLGASLYAWCAATVFMSNLPPLMWGYALLPAVLWATARFMEGWPRASVSLLIVVTLLLLTGHPAIIIYTGMITFAFVACLAPASWPKERSLLRVGVRPATLVILVALAVLIASPQLLPMFQQLPFSARTAGTAVSLDASQNTKHLAPSWIPLSLFPTPFDSSDWTYWSVTMRFPIYVVFLAIVGALFGGRGLRRWYFVGLAVFVILTAMGPHVGLWKLVHSLPVLRNFRFPFRWLGFLPLCVSVLAALGLDRLTRQRGKATTPSFRWILRLLLIVVVAAEAVVILKRQGTYLPAALDALRSRPCLAALLWLSTVGMFVAAFLATRRVTEQRSLVLGVGLTVLSLFATLAFYLQSPAAVRHLETIGWKKNRVPAEPQQYRLSSGLDTYVTWMSNAVTQRHSYMPNLSVFEGRLHTGHYCSFIPSWASDVSSWCEKTLSGVETHGKILDLCSTRWLVEPDAVSSEQTPPEAGPPAPVRERENLAAVPRANIARSAVFCSNDDELIAEIESPAFDPRRTVALLAQDKTLFDPQPASGAATDLCSLPTASILTDRPDHIEVEIGPGAPRDSVMVLSDTYYPGWRAFVDGAEQTILRANYAFRGVRLPEGARRVVFRFDPMVSDAVLVLPTIILMVLGLTLIRRSGSS
ncbi:MAG: hypothetical protein ABFE13_04715 [Phycisphaerales bacterium]